MHEDAIEKSQARRNAKRESKRRVSYGQGQTADWKSATPELVVRAIAAVSRDGGAIRFGYTRDGGAYAIGIMGDGEPYTEYIRPSEDVDAYLKALLEQWEL
jgi:hypothetical protein